MIISGEGGIMFVKKKNSLMGFLQQVVVEPRKEVPLPGREPLEILEEKEKSIINEFKRFCNAIGGTLSGGQHALSCILPAKARVKVEARKSPIYGPKDKIERWYVDVEMDTALETGKRAWFHEVSHTAKIEGVGLEVDVIESEHTEYFSPAFEWTKVEANGVTEIKLETHPVNNDIRLVLIGKKRW